MRKLGSSRRLVALACFCCTPAAFAGDTPDTSTVPESVDLAPLMAAAAQADDTAPVLTISPPTGVVQTAPAPRKKAQKPAAKTSTSDVSSDGPIVLGQGAVALNLSAPRPSSDLSSGASLNLRLPAGAVKAEAKTSVGKDDGNWNAFWRKDSAQVEAQISGPLGSALTVNGENQLGLNYRTAESIGASDSSTHVVRSENQTGRVTLSLPVHPVQVNLGGESASAHTEDTSRDKSTTTSATVRTTDHTAYANMAWSPVPGISMEGGAAARVANISWQDQSARTATFQSLDPHVSVSVSPWRDAKLSAKVEHTVSPYDAAAFANYSRAEGKTVTTGFEPDHAWQMEARLQQAIGPASVSATYTAAQKGTVTEFAEVGGVQAPATTPLLDRESVAVSVTMPLTQVGLPRTDLTSEARWQTSRVIDPVTQQARAASGETPQTVSVKLSHSLPSNNLSFGVTGQFKGASTSYQVSELSATSDSGSVGAFLAYKPGPYEINLNLNGLYGGSTRDEFYRGLRGDSEIGRTAVQDNSGPMLKLSLHKAF